MWPFGERRQNKRRKVAWEASLFCRFMNLNQTVPVTVAEVSLSGARLHLDSMQVGPYHLVVGETPVECELAIDVPQGLVKSNVEFRWYNQAQAEGLFVVGAEFVNMEPECRKILKLAMDGL